MDNFQSLTISVQTVLRSLRGAERHGLNTASLLRRAGISSNLLMSLEGRIPLGQFVRLCRLYSGLLQDEQYGLLENPQRLGTYKVMAGFAVHGRTLGEAIQRYIEIFNLFENSLKYELKIKGRKALFTASRRPGMTVHDAFAIDMALMITHRFCNWLINERIALNKVSLDYGTRGQEILQDHEHQYLFYGAPVLLGTSDNILDFDTSYLERPVIQTEQSLEEYLRNAPENLYLSLEESGQLSLQVRHILASLPESALSTTSLSQIADQLGYPPHKLRRHLKTEGSSFQAIRNAIRRELAIHYLATSNDAVEQIAFTIGYTEAGAFIRAFKNWTGYTPLQFRKNLDDQLSLSR